RTVRVSVTDAKGPGATSLRPEAFTAKVGSATQTSGAARVEIQPDSQALVGAGEYAATVVIEAETAERKPLTLQKTITIVREKAELDVEPLRDALLRVQRRFPTRVAEAGERWLDVINNGPGVLRNATVHVRPVL